MPSTQPLGPFGSGSSTNMLSIMDWFKFYSMKRELTE